MIARARDMLHFLRAAAAIRFITFRAHFFYFLLRHFIFRHCRQLIIFSRLPSFYCLPVTFLLIFMLPLLFR